VRTYPVPQGEVWIIAVSGDGRLLLSGTSGGGLTLWDVPSGRIIKCYGGHGAGVTGAAFVGDGRRFMTSSFDQTIRLWGLPQLGTPSVAPVGSPSLVQTAENQ